MPDLITPAPHTPLPWRFSHNGYYFQIDSDRDGQIGDVCASNCIYHDQAELPKEESHQIAAANAAFIVRAVNNHYALVRALEEIAALALFELSTPTEMRDTAFSLIAKHARAALSAAKGET